jgi:hypothetical protein
MPLIATRGASSVQGFGQFAQSGPVNYIEDMFSTFLYTGTGANRTITNNIDLSTKGGLVWLKGRSLGYNHYLFDTTRGTGKSIYSNLQIAQQDSATTLTAFGSTGFSIGSESDINENATTYASWTFREQPKFFDVVTWSGNSVSGRLISHSLNSAPGCIIVKNLTVGGTNWAVWHRSLATGYNLQLQSTNAAFNTKAQWFNSSTQGSSTTFEVGSDTDTNETGNTYVAYLFAHNAGGFGLTGTDNVISCGSFTADGSGNATVNLGYEPQWVMMKSSSNADNWLMLDTMRGWTNDGSLPGNVQTLRPNLSNAESYTSGIYPRSTGFITTGGNFTSKTYIYIAIRRGPMKVPTTGTSVYNAIARTGTSTAGVKVTGVGFAPDLAIISLRAGSTGEKGFITDRLRGTGVENYLHTSGANAETGDNTGFITTLSLDMDGHSLADTNVFGTREYYNNTGFTYINHFFKRAPGFFDEVCYTGDGGYSSYSHNLKAVPELMIVKARNATSNWSVYISALGFENYVRLNTTAASAGTGDFWYQTPTSTQFSVGGYTEINDTGVTYVNYLFATCAGVSKVGSYTGTGTTKQIDCGFTAGARFVLIKRTDSTGAWYVWDTARGIISGNDPYLLLNSTAVEVTNTDYIDSYSPGFELSSTAPAALNASGGTFIFLAIA